MYRLYVHAVPSELLIKNAFQMLNSIANNYVVGIRQCVREPQKGACVKVRHT